ncbi:Protein of unknown function [Gryllus bimaculatus]|nr:Protein of unknown function [Gryllus bimaculatus]
MYLVIQSFVDPVCRNVVSGQSLRSKMRAMCAVLVIAGSIAVNVFMQSIFLQVFTHGIFGGIGASVVVIQAEAVLSCHFPSQRGLIQVLCTLGVALGHFGMPLLIDGLIHHYGIHGAFLIHSGIILQAVVGAALLSPPQDNTLDAVFTNRPRAYTVVDDVEMIDFSSQMNGHSGHSPLLSADRSWRNPGVDSDARYDVPQTSSPVITLRQKNINGVDILPKIPEESEESCSESDVSYNNVMHQEIKRISSYEKNNYIRPKKSTETRVTIHKESKQFINNKSLQKWRTVNLNSQYGDNVNRELPNCQVSVRNVNNVGYSEEEREASFETYNVTVNFQRFESSPNQRERLSVFENIKYILLCGCCEKTTIYDFYIAFLNLPNDIHFHMVVPLMNAIKVPDFFPAVYFYTVLRLCPIVFTSFTPYLTKRRVVTSSSQEGAFTISVAAFCWLCFLLFSPCFLKAKLATKKFIYFIGSMFLSSGLYIMSSTWSHGYIVLGSAFFGLGYGATSATVACILEGDMGTKNFVKIQGPLDVVSGCTILLTSVLLGVLIQNENGLFDCFFTLSVLQMATIIVWIISMLKVLLQQLRHIANSDWHSGADFMTPG